MLIFLALALLFLLPSPWSFVAFVGVLILWFFELAFWNRTVKHRRRVVGDEALIGKTGSVVRALEPDGQVKVDGELWEARAPDYASVGQEVRVVGRDGLVLVVEAIDAHAR